MVNVVTMKFSDNDEANARTTCDLRGNPVIIFNEVKYTQDTLPPRFIWEYVLIHEEVHIAQIARIGGCNKAIARYQSDPMFRLKSEIEATCVEVQAIARDGWLKDPPKVFEKVFEHVYQRYGTFLPLEEVRKLWKCPQPQPP